MSERYLITGVQLGLLVVEHREEMAKKIMDNIIDKQFIGNSKNDIIKDVKKFINAKVL